MQLQFIGAPSVLLIISGVFLLVGMLFGICKTRPITRRSRRAHIHVNTE
jgi:hypothetical protein